MLMLRWCSDVGALRTCEECGAAARTSRDLAGWKPLFAAPLRRSFQNACALSKTHGARRGVVDTGLIRRANPKRTGI